MLIISCSALCTKWDMLQVSRCASHDDVLKFDLLVSRELRLWIYIGNTTWTGETYWYSTQPPAVIPLLAWDSLHQDLENLIQYSSLEVLTLTVNSALQLKYQCLWQANSIIADTASLRRGPTFLSQCTQGLAWLPLNSLQCTVRANLSCRKQETGLPWQQSTF